MRVTHQIYAAISQQFRHILLKSTRYLVVDATPGGCTKYLNEIKYCLLKLNINVI